MTIEISTEDYNNPNEQGEMLYNLLNHQNYGYQH